MEQKEPISLNHIGKKEIFKREHRLSVQQGSATHKFPDGNFGQPQLGTLAFRPWRKLA